MSSKVLLVGSVCGGFDAFRKRIDAVNTKAGPFQALFCVGQFFEDGDEDEDAPSVVQEAVNDTRPFPVPVYFVAGGGKGSRAALAALEVAPTGCTLKYLGASGITHIAGLKIAFLDDTEWAPGAGKAAQTNATEHSKQLLQQLRSVSDLDLLLTGTWPQGVTTGVPEPEGLNTITESKHSQELATVGRPRYHVSQSRAIFYQRLPYLNPDLGVGCHATRFISPASVGNSSKAKWIHALQLVPAAKLGQAESEQQPADATPSPYVLLGQKRDHTGMGEQSWRWGEDKQKTKRSKPAVPVVTENSIYVKNVPYAAEEDDLEAFFSRAGPVADIRWSSGQDGKKLGYAHVQFTTPEAAAAAILMAGESLMGRELHISEALGAVGATTQALNLGKPVQDCWFCLSNENADVQLVVDVLEEAYLAVDKGPINETHALVLPVEHYPNMLTTLPRALAEIERLNVALGSAYASKGLVLVGFERYLALHSRGGNHCHMNFIGIPKAKEAQVRTVFETTAETYKFSFQHVPKCQGEEGRAAIKEIVKDDQYFQVFLPDGSRLLHVIPRNVKHPMHFGREVLAGLAGVPQRADWRNCKAKDGKEEDVRADAFRTFFGPFSPNNQ